MTDSVDIFVRVYDPRVDTTGANAGRGMGIYRIQYEILDALRNPIAGTINSYQFDSLPQNSATARYAVVYHDSTNWDNGVFYYWVTNAPFSDTANRYWNTKQHVDRQWWKSPAESIEVAKFKDGSYYVRTKSWDVCRPDTNPPDSELVSVVVANFQPKVNETSPTNGQTGVSIHSHIYIRFSEPMNSNVNLLDAISISPGVSGDWVWLSNTEIDFTPDPAFDKNTTYSVSPSS